MKVLKPTVGGATRYKTLIENSYFDGNHNRLDFPNFWGNPLPPKIGKSRQPLICCLGGSYHTFISHFSNVSQRRKQPNRLSDIVVSLCLNKTRHNRRGTAFSPSLSHPIRTIVAYLLDYRQVRKLYATEELIEHVP